ncbi:MAG: MBL fold metallo-hydrolase [Candidatus Thorarchaeota archaeon]
MELKNAQKIMIDSKNVKIPPKMNAIVTHAHSDHFAVMNSYSPTFATQETIDLFNSQSNQGLKPNLNPVKFNEKIPLTETLDETSISLIPSGHVLGSASVYIESQEDSLLFSGDIGGKGLLTLKTPLTTKKANTLIVEATFGSPEIIFPPREDISMEILKWTAEVVKKKMNVVFSAGRIGSSQELIKMFNSLTNLRVVTHGEVTPVSEVYQRHGVKLDFFDSKSEEGREILRDGDAVIIQPRGNKLVPYFITEHIQCKTAIVTGMATRFQYSNYDASFPLSSHANFMEIIDYVNQVQPKEVYTIYGLEKKLAQAIYKELDIPAKPLKIKDSPVDILPIEEIRKSLPQPSFLTKRSEEVDVLSSPKEKRQFTLDDFLPDN